MQAPMTRRGALAHLLTGRLVAQQEKPPAEVVDVLQFALTLERLENTFYRRALEEGGLIPAGVRVVFETIEEHETEHVAFLEEALGEDVPDRPDFDYTAGGRFEPFEDYDTFLLLAQGFEDTGQRAYRGAVRTLAGTPEVLTDALRIHAVEARHAAIVRRLRDLQGWIPLEQPDAPEAIQAVYDGMDQTEKYGVDLPEVSEAGERQITEAFDEPLSKDAVLEIVEPFIGG